MENRIGNFSFLFLHGQPDPPKEQVELVVRGGVDGLGIWRTGVRGKPFKMMSQVDLASMDAARQEFFSYRDLIGADPVSLIQNGLDFTAEGWLVEVLDVEEAARFVLLAYVGGLSSGSGAFLIAHWTLVAIQQATQ